MSNERYTERAHANMTLSVAIERDYGDVKISYGLSGVYIISNLSELNTAYEELRAQCETQHELAQKNRPAMMPMALKSQVSMNSIVILCTAVRKESVQGKDRIRLLGGEFATHGIAVYPEYMEDLKIDPTQLTWGDNPYNNYVLVELNGAGQPKRAVTIVTEEKA